MKLTEWLDKTILEILRSENLSEITVDELTSKLKEKLPALKNYRLNSIVGKSLKRIGCIRMLKRGRKVVWLVPREVVGEPLEKT